MFNLSHARVCVALLLSQLFMAEEGKSLQMRSSLSGSKYRKALKISSGHDLFTERSNAFGGIMQASLRRDFWKHAVNLSSIVSVVALCPAGASAKRVNPSKRVGGLPNIIYSVCRILDELQRDLMQERWDLVENYPARLRSYVPIFTAYTDAVFPSDTRADKSYRVALRYEVGRMFSSVGRLSKAVEQRALDDAYVAYSDVTVHFDRYLYAGNLYTYEQPQPIKSTEALYNDVKDSQLIYSNPYADPAEVRDLIVLCRGPDLGKTGILIGIYRDNSDTCVVKLDKLRYNYVIREIRVVPRLWAAKRIGEQDPDEVFLIPRKVRKKAIV